VFRLGWTGVGGDIITRSSAHDGKGDTGAREGREKRCSDGHGELQLRRSPDGGGRLNATPTSVHRPNGVLDELGEMMVELWANWWQRFRGGE